MRLPRGGFLLQGNVPIQAGRQVAVLILPFFCARQSRCVGRPGRRVLLSIEYIGARSRVDSLGDTRQRPRIMRMIHEDRHEKS
jgi:hypothetical protein